MKKKEIIDRIKGRKMALTITIGNQKGGVGKTTNATIMGYMLAKFGLKVLVADLDPQSNATKALVLTKSLNSENEIGPIKKTLMRGVQEKDLTTLPINIVKNLFLLPSFIDFEDFAKYLYRNTNTSYEEDHFLEPLFRPLQEQYDVIILDVPPMNIEVTKNAVVMSDYVLISLQTQERSLTGAESYVDTLASLKLKYKLPVDVIGFLQVLHRNHGTVDKFIMENATKEFGYESMFKTIVPQMERIKRFDINGISEKDQFDKKVIDVYREVTDEFLDRVAEYEF
uniref:ParA family protein n=1 Tax=Lentilactobacillus hilgardii TaxID=1588 RepID=UPI00403FA298